VNKYAIELLSGATAA